MRSTDSRARGLVGDPSQAIVLVCLLAFGLALKASYDMNEASAYRLPRAVAFAGLILASLELAMGHTRPWEGNQSSTRTQGLPVQVSIGFAAAYFALVPLLGFIPSTALAIAGFGHVTRFPRMKLVLVLAGVVPLLLYLTFGRLLQAPLPTGLLGALHF